jgi:hypothetical protein
MDEQSKQGKSTGYTPPIKTAVENVSPPVESTDKKKVSPVLINAPTKGASLNLEVAVSASNILAVLVMMGDFKAVKTTLPQSRQASHDGKIYWCVEYVGHSLEIVDGKLLVDNILAEDVLAKLLAT